MDLEEDQLAVIYQGYDPTIEALLEMALAKINAERVDADYDEESGQRVIVFSVGCWRKEWR